MDNEQRYDDYDTRDREKEEDESVVIPSKESLRDSYIRTTESVSTADRAEWPAEKRLISVFPSEAKYCGTRRTKKAGMM